MTEENKWKTGNKVRLVSGGPTMTVVRVREIKLEERTLVECQWFDAAQNLQNGAFPPENLVADTD